MIDITELTRTLRVYLSPSLAQKIQFEIIRGKISRLVIKIMITNINPFQAMIYFNAYIIKSMYFGCRIAQLNKKEENELK